jgi:hypothetical protein
MFVLLLKAILREAFVNMLKNKKNLCILGGNDDLTHSFYNYIKKKFNNVIYINFSNKKITGNKNFFNLNLYELRKCLNILDKHSINELVFLGKVSRPNLTKFKLDGVIDKYLDKIFNAYKEGDGEILDIVISIFNEKGFKIVPINKLTSNFSFETSSNTIFEHNNCDQNDINKALNILNDLSKYDNAQSLILDNGYILAIEAAEGTDEMIDRVYKYKKIMKFDKKRSGIFVKLPKKNQSLKIDLPVIGTKTIKLLKKAKINSIVVSKKHTIVNDVNKTLAEIKRNKINLYLI